MRSSLRAHDSYVQLESGDYLIAWLGMRRKRPTTARARSRSRSWTGSSARARPRAGPNRAEKAEPARVVATSLPQTRPRPGKKKKKKPEVVSRNAPDLITAVLQERSRARTTERLLNDNLPRVGARYRKIVHGDMTPTHLVYSGPNSAGTEAINAMVHGSMPTEQVMREVDQHMLELVIDDLSINTLKPGTQVVLDIC
ncbi:MAG: hypothetical protein R3C97_15625 [Geminicoccaceae bacterium]